jgi:hypothetical protein
MRERVGRWIIEAMLVVVTVVQVKVGNRRKKEEVDWISDQKKR